MRPEEGRLWRHPVLLACCLALLPMVFQLIPTSTAVASAQANLPRPAAATAFPPYPPVCTQAQLGNVDVGVLANPGCLQDYHQPPHSDAPVEGSSVGLTPSSNDIVFPTAAYGATVPISFTVSGYPACTLKDTSGCIYANSIGPFNLEPSPAGYLPDDAIGIHVSCQVGTGWTNSCSGTAEIQYNVPSDLTALANHWVIVKLSTQILAPQLADETLEYTEIAMRFSVGCASDPTAPGCQPPLKVFVKQLEPLRSGLAVHSVHYKDNPVDFTASAPSSGIPSAHYACQSGCTDILISVINPMTGKPPDPGATVKVSLGLLQIGSQQVSNGRVITPPSFGDGSLCETDPDGDDFHCGGATLSGITTDNKGQATLRYWAPGVLADATTILGVTASCSSCNTSPGTSRTTLAEKPYEIYQKSGDLSLDDASELAEWAAGPTAFNLAVENEISVFDVLKDSLITLKAAEVAAHKVEQALEAVEDAEPLVLLTEVALKINEAFEAQGMFALFLDNSGLSPFGIGATPFEASADGNPSASFVHELMGQLAVPAFLRAGNAGFWWAAANDIRTVLKTTSQPTFDTYQWSLSTSVYEVSHCAPADGTCGPGYGNRPGTAAVINGGIEPELVVELSLVHAGVSIEDAGFVTQYDALAWTTTQPDLQGVINDF